MSNEIISCFEKFVKLTTFLIEQFCSKRLKFIYSLKCCLQKLKKKIFIRIKVWEFFSSFTIVCALAWDDKKEVSL